MVLKSKMLLRREVPAYLLENFGIRRTKKTFDKLATVGGGPKYHRTSKECLYNTDDLDAWAMDLIGEPMASTSGRAA